MFERDQIRAVLIASLVAIVVGGCGAASSSAGAPTSTTRSTAGSTPRRCAPKVVTTVAELPPNSGQSDAMAFAQQRRDHLNAATQAELDRQLAQARTAVLRYPTAKDARDAGYVKSSGEQPGGGAHWTNWDVILRCRFDPAQPSQLLYRGSGERARLVALSYFVVSVGHPPDGFAGPNDTWHEHLGLCIRKAVNLGLVRNGGFSLAQCAHEGGTVYDGRDLWMLHAWVVPGWVNPWGVFASANPKLM